jgi:hypothetical protein
MPLGGLIEVQISRGHEGIGDEKKPTLVTDIKVTAQPVSLFGNCLLYNGAYVSFDGTKFGSSVPTAAFRAAPLDQYQVYLSRLAWSLFKFHYIAFRRHIVRHDSHDGLGDPSDPVICRPERPSEIEE